MKLVADLVKVGSEEDIETGDVAFKLGFRLPTGDMVYATASSDIIVSLKKYSEYHQEGSNGSPGGGSHTEPEWVAEDPTEESLGASQESVEWSKLPETLLPAHVKVAMKNIATMPDRLELSQAMQIRDAILDEYTPEDWIKIGFSPGAIEGPQQAGTISWSEGSTHNPVFVPQRTVANVDGKGNPIVPQVQPEIDPGEIADTGDEDGTDQF